MAIISEGMDLAPGRSGGITIFLETYVPTLLLYANNSLLVPFMIYYVASYECSDRKSNVERSIFAKYFVYMLFDSIILPSFGLTTIYSLFEHRNWLSLSIKA